MSLKFWKFFVVWAMSCMQAYAVVDRFCCHDCTSHMVIGAPIWIRGTLWCSSHVCHHQEACLPGMSTGGMLSSPSKPITKQFSLCQWPSQQPYERYNKRSNPSSHISCCLTSGLVGARQAAFLSHSTLRKCSRRRTAIKVLPDPVGKLIIAFLALAISMQSI
eukprot:GHVN01092029.1.p1 GENE.GHVN01092029.1~~GHVN01092029.1.p1  ORF type:complete len:162 (-),score=8.19 GHVN01092029.1:557-1042(-)